MKVARIVGTGMAVPGCVVDNRLLSRCMDTSDDLRIIEAVAEPFKIPPDRTYNNVHRYGNTAAASVPICLHEAVGDGRVREGDLLLLAALGTGLSWGSTLLRW